VYVLFLLICLLALNIFPVRIIAAEGKGIYKTLINPTFREYPGVAQDFDDMYPICVPDGKTLAFVRVYRDEKDKDKNGIYMFQPSSVGRYITPIITGQNEYSLLNNSNNSKQFFYLGYFSWLQIKAAKDNIPQDDFIYRC